MKLKLVGLALTVAGALCVMAGPPQQEEMKTINTIDLNLATNLRGLLKFTTDKGAPCEVDTEITTNGADPVQDVTIRLKYMLIFSQSGAPFTVNMKGIRIHL